MLFIRGSVKEAVLPTQAAAIASQRIEEVIGAMLVLDLAELATHSEVVKNLRYTGRTSLETEEHVEYSLLPPGWMAHVDGASFPPLRVREIALRIVAKHPDSSRPAELLEQKKATGLRAFFESGRPSAVALQRGCRQYARAVLEPELGELFVLCVVCLVNRPGFSGDSVS